MSPACWEVVSPARICHALHACRSTPQARLLQGSFCVVQRKAYDKHASQHEDIMHQHQEMHCSKIKAANYSVQQAPVKVHTLSARWCEACSSCAGHLNRHSCESHSTQSRGACSAAQLTLLLLQCCCSGEKGMLPAKRLRQQQRSKAGRLPCGRHTTSLAYCTSC